ncbi:MAG: hypothetical protein LBI49_26000 [Nocardiopsaceae bacterium]|jgi:hypothetical protein|nr:hypothetical protein [Nocardiopsaceae bacterium]
MADLVVDYALLEGIENTLNSLKGQFDNINAVSQAADWGDPRISSAMGDFAGNWKDHRAKLVSSMQAMAKNANECRTATDKYDTGMQQQLAKK